MSVHVQETGADGSRRCYAPPVRDGRMDGRVTQATVAHLDRFERDQDHSPGRHTPRGSRGS